MWGISGRRSKQINDRRALFWRVPIGTSALDNATLGGKPPLNGRPLSLAPRQIGPQSVVLLRLGVFLWQRGASRLGSAGAAAGTKLQVARVLARIRPESTRPCVLRCWLLVR